MTETTKATRSETKSRWSGVGIRLITAIAIVLVCIAPFYFGGWFWTALVALFSGRMMYEWVRMADPAGGRWALLLAIGGLMVALLYAGQGFWLWAMAAILAFTGFGLAERVRRGGLHWTLIGLPYVAIPAVVIIGLRGMDVGFATRGFSQLIFIIVVVIGADVGAYFGGSQFGGPKLAPKLSPNKTWSGAVSGLLFGMLIGAIAGKLIGLPLHFGALLAVPFVILSVLGDLLESAFKRRLGVKDAGSLLPGHGGLLDRLDSLMAAVVGGAVIFDMIGSRWPFL